MDYYDTGLLGDGGGGDIEWWHDYIRAELGRAHEFYESQAEQSATTLRQLESLLEKSGTVTLSRMWANFGVRVHTKDCVGDAKTLTDAIAAAHAAKE